MNLYVLRILEGIVAVLPVVLYLYVVGVHEEVVAVLDAHVLQRHVVAVPQHLLTVGEVGVFHVYALHAAEHLRCIDLASRHAAVAGIPQA